MNDSIDQDVLTTFSENEDEDFLQELMSLYTPQRILGTGAFSSVFQANDIYGNTVAIKVIDKRVSGKSAKREVEILSSLDHPNILKLFQSRESSRKIYLITELVEGQTLDSFLATELTDDQIVFIIKQLLLAIQYVHSIDVIHRDIKPENIIINNSTLKIKLIDFGLSFLSQSQSFQTTHENCGTLIFMAPEMALKKEYYKSVDIWSCGIIQYMLFSRGIHPIWVSGVDTRQTYLEKLQQLTDWQFPTMTNLAAQNFFKKTASSHPESRMSASQSLLHPWISGQGELNSPITMTDMVQSFLQQQNLIKLVKAQVLLKYMITQCDINQSVQRKKISIPQYFFALKPINLDLGDDSDLLDQHKYNQCDNQIIIIDNNNNEQQQLKNISQPDEDTSPLVYQFKINNVQSANLHTQQIQRNQFVPFETQGQGSFTQFMKNQKSIPFVRKFDSKKKSQLFSPQNKQGLTFNLQMECSIDYNQSPLQQQQAIKQMRSSSTVFINVPSNYAKQEKLFQSKTNFSNNSPSRNNYCSPSITRKNISQHIPNVTKSTDGLLQDVQLQRCESLNINQTAEQVKYLQKTQLPPLVPMHSSPSLPSLNQSGSPNTRTKQQFTESIIQGGGNLSSQRKAKNIPLSLPQNKKSAFSNNKY